MPELDDGNDPRPSAPSADLDPIPHFELGGPIQEQALPDHGRLIIRREGVTLEGSTSAVVMGIGAAGTVFSAVVALQPHGRIAGLVSIVAILAQNLSYFGFRQRSGLPPERRRHRRKARRPDPTEGAPCPHPSSRRPVSISAENCADIGARPR